MFFLLLCCVFVSIKFRSYSHINHTQLQKHAVTNEKTLCTVFVWPRAYFSPPDVGIHVICSAFPGSPKLLDTTPEISGSGKNKSAP